MKQFIDDALKHYISGDYIQGISELTKVIEQGHASAEAYSLLARLQFGVGAYESALKNIDEARKLNSKNERLDLLQALAYQGIKDSRSSELILIGLTESRDIWISGMAQSYIYYLKRDYLNSYESLISADSADNNDNDPSINLFHASLLLLLKRYKESRDVLHANIKISPKNASNFIALGEVEYKLANYEKANDAYEDALQLDPKNIVTYRRLFWLDLRRGRLRSAWNRVRTAIQNAELA